MNRYYYEKEEQPVSRSEKIGEASLLFPRMQGEMRDGDMAEKHISEIVTAGRASRSSPERRIYGQDRRTLKEERIIMALFGW